MPDGSSKKRGLLDSLTDAEWSLLLSGGGSGGVNPHGASLGAGGNATLGVEVPWAGRRFGLEVDGSGGASAYRPSAAVRRYGATDENSASGQIDRLRATLGDPNGKWSFETDPRLGLDRDFRNLTIRYTGQF